MPEPTRWRKRPVEIEAMQWDGTAEGATPIIHWVLDHGGIAVYRCDGPGGCPGTEDAHYLVIHTPEGDMLASSGGYVIRGLVGEFYPCAPDVFAKTYEQVQETLIPRTCHLDPWCALPEGHDGEHQ